MERIGYVKWQRHPSIGAKMKKKPTKKKPKAKHLSKIPKDKIIKMYVSGKIVPLSVDSAFCADRLESEFKDAVGHYKCQNCGEEWTESTDNYSCIVCDGNNIIHIS